MAGDDKTPNAERWLLRPVEVANSSACRSQRCTPGATAAKGLPLYASVVTCATAPPTSSDGSTSVSRSPASERIESVRRPLGSNRGADGFLDWGGDLGEPLIRAAGPLRASAAA